MTIGKLFVNNAADTLKELLSFHHRIKSAWKEAYGTEDTPVVKLRLHWYLIPNLLPCKLKKNFLKEPSHAQKMSPAPDTNLDTYNSVQKAKLKTEQELLQLCQGCGSFPFLISIIYLFTGAASLDNSLLQILKPWMKNSTGNQAQRKVLEGWTTASFFVASGFRKPWSC